MKPHFIPRLGLAALAGISLVTPALATVNIDYVTVGNGGNAADTTGYGAVANTYQISKNETTISQYAEFLNAAATTDDTPYNTGMGLDLNVAGITRSGVYGSYTYSVLPGTGNRPIAYVSWFDAARFCNWLQNGQGSGSTETGAYTLNGATSGIITKNVGATVWIPSEDEWYKAAYYDPNKGGAGVGGYWAQATQSNTVAGNTIGVASSANYFDGDYAVTHSGSYSISQNYLTDVGAYGLNSDSAYGTNDQGGNLFEWNDAVFSGSRRGVRGGGWSYGALSMTDERDGYLSTFANDSIGFRVASTMVLLIPDIALEAPTGTPVANVSGTLAYDSIAPGQTHDLNVTVRNTGSADLTTIVASLTGPDAGQFALVSTPPATLTAGASAPFKVRFSPTSLGSKSATLSIASNDPDENPFTLSLTGDGVTPPEAWRYLYFQTIANTGDAADNADPDRDGLVNLLERAFNLDPTQSGTPMLTADIGTSGLPLVRRTGEPAVFSIQYLRHKASANSGLTYTPQFSSDLTNIAPDGWSPATGTETVESIDTEWERVTLEEDAGGKPKRFGRVKVSSQ